MPASKASFTRIDASAERNSCGMFIPVLNSGNVDAYTDTAGATLVRAVLDAFDGVCLSAEYAYSAQAVAEQSYSGTPPAQPAQNELRLVLKTIDTVEGSIKGRIEIPGVDAATVGAIGTDNVDLTQTEMVALITAVENFAVSKIGNPIQVYEATIVGRNS